MFHVGQFVVCVDDRVEPYEVPGVVYLDDFEDGWPRRGVVYTVRDAGKSVYDDTPCIWLAEIVRPARTIGREEGFAAARFRPLKDEALSVFRQALEPSPKQTETA
jgi:hypothetical protein